jgi:hypothetical protein
MLRQKRLRPNSGDGKPTPAASKRDIIFSQPEQLNEELDRHSRRKSSLAAAVALQQNIEGVVYVHQHGS